MQAVAVALAVMLDVLLRRLPATTDTVTVGSGGAGGTSAAVGAAGDRLSSDRF
jgi:hypothetical protein